MMTKMYCACRNALTWHNTTKQNKSLSEQKMRCVVCGKEKDFDKKESRRMEKETVRDKSASTKA